MTNQVDPTRVRAGGQANHPLSPRERAVNDKPCSGFNLGEGSGIPCKFFPL